MSISTRAVGRLSKMEKVRSIKTNVTSHNEMLEAAGLATGDTFFQNVPGLADKVVHWGQEGTPVSPLVGRNDEATDSGGGVGSGRNS